MRRITKEPWFGPKRFVGWGWRIASPQDLVVTVVFGALAVSGVFLLRRWSWLVLLVLLALYQGVVVLTEDPPGGLGSHHDDATP
jgi:hypothetical protein